MFLLCDWASQVWFCNPFTFKVDKYKITRIDAWFSSLVSDMNFDSFELAVLAMLCWYIWKDMCALVFENHMLNPVITIDIAFAAANEFWTANGWSHGLIDIVTSEKAVQSWKPPPQDFVKVNMDGAFVKDGSKVGVVLFLETLLVVLLIHLVLLLLLLRLLLLKP